LAAEEPDRTGLPRRPLSAELAALRDAGCAPKQLFGKGRGWSGIELMEPSREVES
jgi:hypothetical protein